MNEVESGVRKKALYPLKNGSKYGYLNNLGEWVVEPRFDRAFEFFEDSEFASLSASSDKGKIHGYASKSGEYLTFTERDIKKIFPDS